MHQLRVEVEEGRDDDVGRHRAHRRRPRREVARPPRDAETGVRLRRLGHEIDHAVQWLQGPPRLARQQGARGVSTAVVDHKSLLRSQSLCQLTRRRHDRAAARIVAHDQVPPLALAFGHTDLTADEQSRQVVPAVEGARSDHQVGVQHSLGHGAALEGGRAQGPVLRPARVQAGKSRNPHNGPLEVLGTPRARWPGRPSPRRHLARRRSAGRWPGS